MFLRRRTCPPPYINPFLLLFSTISSTFYFQTGFTYLLCPSLGSVTCLGHKLPKSFFHRCILHDKVSLRQGLNLWTGEGTRAPFIWAQQRRISHWNQASIILAPTDQRGPMSIMGVVGYHITKISPKQFSILWLYSEGPVVGSPICH